MQKKNLQILDHRHSTVEFYKFPVLKSESMTQWSLDQLVDSRRPALNSKVLLSPL